MSSYLALHERRAWLSLSRGLLRVSGEDAARLLHAMSTNHVQAMAVGDQLYAFFLNAQGRILADAWILRREDHYLLDTEAAMRESLFQHLDKFIIADDVTIEDVTSEYHVVSLETPGGTDFSAVGFPNAIRQYLPAGTQPATDLPQATADDAEVVRIENGRPRYGTDLSEKYLVQETQQLQAVSFNKGCYLGQEIVERVRARGAVHKHLTQFEVDGDAVPAPGTELQAAGAKAGLLTSAAYSPARQAVVALGYLNVAYESGGQPLTLGGDLPRSVRVQRTHPV